MGMIFIPGVGSGGNPNPVGSGWDPGWIGWDDELLFFSKFFKVLEDIPREYSPGILCDRAAVEIPKYLIYNGPPSKDPAAVAKNSRKRLILCFYDFFMLTWYVLISIFEF